MRQQTGKPISEAQFALGHMTDAWSHLTEGVTYKFCFLVVDLAGHSLIIERNNHRDANETFTAFLEYIEAHVHACGGQTWRIAGDGGLFAFHDIDITAMAEQGVTGALSILDGLEDFNATKSKVTEQICVRIAIHLGDAPYRKEKGFMVSDDINFVAHLEKMGTAPDTVSISETIHRELDREGLGRRFRIKGQFEGRTIYAAQPIRADAADVEEGIPNVESGTRYAVVVGISLYQDNAIPNLKFAAKDARAVSEVLKKWGRFSEDHIKLLIDEAATATNVKAALFDLQNAQEDDFILVYFACHGAPGASLSQTGTSDQMVWKYLLPHDADSERLAHNDDKTISLEGLHRILGALDTWRKVVFLDSCYSGTGQRSYATVGIRGQISEAPLDNLAGKGCQILSASRSTELAYESDEKEHGLFTYHLLQGLQGAADPEKKGWVDIHHLYEHLKTAVAEEAQRLKGRQNPILKGDIRSFPLTFPPSLTQIKDDNFARLLKDPSMRKDLCQHHQNAEEKNLAAEWQKMLTMANYLPIDMDRVADLVASDYRMWLAREKVRNNAKKLQACLSGSFREIREIALKLAEEETLQDTLDQLIQICQDENALPDALYLLIYLSRISNLGVHPQAYIEGRRRDVHRTILADEAKIPIPKTMVRIPTGWFCEMASGMPHQRFVFLKGYAIDRYAVTNRDYRKFLECMEDKNDHRLCFADEPRGHSHIPAGWDEKGVEDENAPVVGIDWYDAYAYAAWAGKRLPTTAEWEKAGFWDDKQKKRRLYPWGDRFDPQKCGSLESSIGQPVAVGTFSEGASPYGLFDMVGNIWEWCADWDTLLQAAQNVLERNPEGPEFGDRRVIRGGSWQDSDRQRGPLCRSSAYPLHRSQALGFRCALSLNSQRNP